MPRAAESSRARGNDPVVGRRKCSGQRCTRANGRARAPNTSTSRAAGGGRLVPGLFQSQSPLTVALRRAGGFRYTAYAALTPHLRPLTYNPPAMQLFQDWNTVHA